MQNTILHANGCPFHSAISAPSSFYDKDILTLKSLKNDLPQALEDYRDYLSDFFDWVQNFLSAPNTSLGRKGDVCPFTLESYERDFFWVNIQTISNLSLQKGVDILSHFKEIFLMLTQEKCKENIFKTITVLFPNINPDRYYLIENIQQKLKPHFVSMGLMIGQFYPACPRPGLRSIDFRPLHSPIPLLVIRNMVKSDIAFLQDDPEFVKCYKRIFPKGFHEIQTS